MGSSHHWDSQAQYLNRVASHAIEFSAYHKRRAAIALCQERGVLTITSIRRLGSGRQAPRVAPDLAVGALHAQQSLQRFEAKTPGDAKNICIEYSGAGRALGVHWPLFVAQLPNAFAHIGNRT